MRATRELTPEPEPGKTIDQAGAELETLMDRLAAEGFDINGWDDGTVNVFREGEGNRAIQPRRGT